MGDKVVDAGEKQQEDGGEFKPTELPTKYLPAGQKNEDAFDKAFLAAEREVAGADKLKPKAEKKVEEKPKAVKVEQDKKPAPPEKKPVAKAETKEVVEASDDGEDELEDEDEEPQPAKRKLKTFDPDEALKPKTYWPQRRRDQFDSLPRDVQERWLNEAPTPHEHWPAEWKENFSKQPEEVQEAWLDQAQRLERGYHTRIQQLDGEVKFADSIRKVIPENIREVMTQRKMGEAQVFETLLGLQAKAMNDPAGYIRDFFKTNNLDPAKVFVEGWDAAQQQVDIESHPVVKSMKQELTALKGHVTSDIQQREQQTARELATSMDGLLKEKAKDGGLRFPYANLLAPHMAAAAEKSPPEAFAGMDFREQFAALYDIALRAHPELARLSADRVKAVEEEIEDDDPEIDEPETLPAKKKVVTDKERAKAAASKKPSKPTSSAGNGKPGDAFDRAYNAAAAGRRL